MPERAWQGVERGRTLAPGLGLALFLALLSFATWWWLKDSPLKFSALLWAFIFSILVGNTWPGIARGSRAVGLEFSSTRLLRLAVALLGLTISASVWTRLGAVGVAAVLINLLFALLFGALFCRYLLKMEGALAVLLGVGTGICGASAIAATGPALRARAEQMALALGTITLFGLVAMFTYPLLFHWALGRWLEGDALAYGLWTGMGVHETAQVIAAASPVEGALSMAVTAKAIRIFMIGPMVFSSLFILRRLAPAEEGAGGRLPIPWFALAFVLFTLLHTGLEASPMGEGWAEFNANYLKPATTFLLAWAMAGVGFQVRASALRQVGLNAFLGGMAVALTASATALLLTKYLWLALA